MRLERNAIANVWPTRARIGCDGSVATDSSSDGTGAGETAGAGVGPGVCAAANESEAPMKTHVAAIVFGRFNGAPALKR